MTSQENIRPFHHLLKVRQLDTRLPNTISLTPPPGQRRDIATLLGVAKINKLRFDCKIVAEGERDWRLEGKLGATVVQPCVLTLAPVTTRIDIPVTRMFLADFPTGDNDEEEVEISGDETLEPLRGDIDVGVVMTEALALALPLYPKARDAQLDQGVFAEPGVKPMSDDDVRPFAGLSGLRDMLEKKE
jgi:uncharacterized metal-binding protein YceD (DUF177 family)